MASFTALRTSRRPFSLLATHKPSVSSISNSGSVRWASIVPYTITATGPPAPPMTLEQVALLQQRKQQTLLEEQIQLEKSQRARQQLELRQQLARHRNRILEQQREEQQKAATAAAAAAAGVETGAKDKEGTQRVGEEQRQPTRESRRGPRSTRQDGEVTEAAEASHASMFVGTRRRSMFGYRGPEHSTLGAEAQEEEEETRYAEVAVQSQRRVLVAAEDRVQLAMMDYSPREIDAMSPEQVQKILSSTSRASESVEEEEQDLDKVHTFDDVISPPTSPPTTSTSSVELELDSCLAKSTSSST
ncbi:hypothetical protein BGZ74_001477 [Mortierella antarctica]|nr:hypothetical protein BGZ74_001477 [Mortierella antarctica]